MHILSSMAVTQPCLFFFFLIILKLHTRTRAQEFCTSASCEIGGVSIEFPFWLKQENQSRYCGYPGFELACSNQSQSQSQRQPLLNIPLSGNFVVKLISLEDQRVWINDPNDCFPKRFLTGFNLEGSQFQLSDYYTFVNLSFFDCPSNLASSSFVQPINCLNDYLRSNNNANNYSVVALVSNPPFQTPWMESCRFIASAEVPVPFGDTPWLFWTEYYSDVQLQWDSPNCGTCLARGGRCGFLDQPSFGVDCYDLPNHNQGLSRKAKYGLSLGVGIPGIMGIIVLTCFFCCKKHTSNQQRQAITEFSTAITPHSSVITLGLDMASIEKYPKTQLGESGRLPKPNDNICSICLCDYLPKETLRTIPDCNHYFHADCIDGWLKVNAACPLCRTLPERSYSLLYPPLSPSPA